jgi:hypothetical protein
LIWQRPRVYTNDVAQRSSQSEADVVLARQASRIGGRRVTPGQIRRWRKMGLLPMKKKGLGRGRAWLYEYPEGSAEFAAAIGRELPRYKRLDRAALAAFAHGSSPGDKKVLVRLLSAPYKEVRSALDPNPHRAAAGMANKASRRASRYPLLRQVKQDHLDRPGDLATLLRGALDSAFTWEPTGLQQVFEALNVSVSMSEELTGETERLFGGQEPMEIAKLGVEVMQKASLADFEQARDDALLANKAAGQITQALAAPLGIGSDREPVEDDAEAMALVPAFLVMRLRWGGEDTDAFLQFLNDPMPLFGQIVEAFQSWAGSTNPEDAKRLGPLALAILERTLHY